MASAGVLRGEGREVITAAILLALAPSACLSDPAFRGAPGTASQERHLPPGARRCPTGVRTSSDHFLCRPCGGPSGARNSRKLRLSCCMTPGQPAGRGSNIVSSPPQDNPQVSGSRASLIASGVQAAGYQTWICTIPKTPLGFCMSPIPYSQRTLPGRQNGRAPAGWGARRRLSRAVPRCTRSHRGRAGRSRRGRRRRSVHPMGENPGSGGGCGRRIVSYSRKTPPL